MGVTFSTKAKPTDMEDAYWFFVNDVIKEIIRESHWRLARRHRYFGVPSASTSHPNVPMGTITVSKVTPFDQLIDKAKSVPFNLDVGVEWDVREIAKKGFHGLAWSSAGFFEIAPIRPEFPRFKYEWNFIPKLHYASTIIHETTHCLRHADNKLSTNVKEFEAEMCAALWHHFSGQTLMRVRDYLGWGRFFRSPESFAKVATKHQDRVLETVNEILGATI